MIKFFVSILLSHFIFSQSFNISNGEMRFVAVARTIGIESDLVGEGKGLSGNLDLDEKKFSFVYDLWEMDTGIELRNDHMHENYLETEDYPEAKFSGKIIELKENEIHVRGIFSLHGVEKEIEVIGSIENNILIAKWDLSLKDFDIEIPQKFLVAKLDEKLSMEIKCTLVESE